MPEYLPTKGHNKGIGIVFGKEDFSTDVLYCNLKYLINGYKKTGKKVFKDLIDEYNQELARRER